VVVRPVGLCLAVALQSPGLVRPIEPLARVAGPSLDAPTSVFAARLRPTPTPHEPGRPFSFREQVMRAEVAPRDVKD
jgi:hypothetical protein